MTQRIALLVEYEGTQFHGWQAQPNVRTVQDCLQHALAHIARHPVQVTCAGRTDKGVHATGQVIHFDTTTQRRLDSWLMGTNYYLPPDIRVLQAQAMNGEFHARFSALSRHYRYVIHNHRTRPALYRHHVGWYYYPLDADKMHNAAQHLVGEHDFSSFRAQECQAHSPIRRIINIQVYRQGNDVILEVTANAFLHHMVRNIVGTLLLVGSGKKPVEWLQEVLSAQNRTAAGITAPPQGLYLVNVDYPKSFLLWENKTV